MRTVLLHTVIPCCGGERKVRLAAIEDVPREIYVRRCPDCRRRWEIERRTARQSAIGRIDILEWSPSNRHWNILTRLTEEQRAVLAKAGAK